MLNKFCDESGFSEKIFNIVSKRDPVPRILSFSMGLQAIVKEIDSKVCTYMPFCIHLSVKFD
jgi:hypothetical protein